MVSRAETCHPGASEASRFARDGKGTRPMTDYTYQDLNELVAAMDGGYVVRREDIDPGLLRRPVWVATIAVEGGYLPYTHYYTTKRANAAGWLRAMGARNLGRAGAACDYQRGLTFELAEYLVTELL
jgi:hypothetical protein